MSRARVGVVTRTKNRPVLLARALDSVLDQTFQDWQLVVVNDGGDPLPVEDLIERRRHRFRGRVNVLHHGVSKGMEAASNAGIRVTDSDLLVIHDDDDSWDPAFLAECVRWLDRNAAIAQVGGVITHSARVVEHVNGERVVIAGNEPFNTWVRAVTVFRMAAQNMFPPISFVYKRSALEAIGGYREDLPVLGDWEFNLRFVQRYEIGVVQKVLARYHHRVLVKDGANGNTVIAGDDLHKFYDAALRNELLRRDLADGKVGMGLLVNVARNFEDVFGLLDRGSLFLYVKDKAYRLAQRAKLLARG